MSLLRQVQVFRYRVLEGLRRYYAQGGFEKPFISYLKLYRKLFLTITIGVPCITTPLHLLLIWKVPWVGAKLEHDLLALGLPRPVALGLAAVLSSLALALLLDLVMSLLYFSYPLYMARRRRYDIEKNLIYTVAQVATLATAGLRLDLVLERVSDIEPSKAIAQELRKIVRDVKILGVDLYHAMEEAIERSPSPLLSEFLRGLIDTARTSGNIGNYAVYKVEDLLRSRTENMRATLSTLMMLLETYVVVMVVLPLLLTIMLIVMSMITPVLGIGALTVPVPVLLMLTIFILVPTMGVAMYIIFDTVLSRL